jgi:ABC-type bacteriocin/lantibiotic exporter with double-glycine peptidase domain
MNRNKQLKIPKPVRTPTILQFEAAECGAAALAIILAFYGKWVPLTTLRRQLGVSRDGTNILKLRDTARDYGFDVKASRYIPGDFALLKYPAICHWDGAHFLVIEGADTDKCYLSDPASGRRTVTHQEFFDSTPTRIILELKPTSNFVRSGSPPDIIKGIVKRLERYRSVLLTLALLAVLSTVPTIGLAAVSSTLINQVLVDGRGEFLNGLVTVSVALLLLALPIYRIQLVLFRKLGLALARSLSINYLLRLLALPISFYDSRHASELNQRLGLNEVFANNMAGQNGQALVNIFASFIYALILLFISTPLALVCFVLQSSQILLLLTTRSERNDKAIQLGQAEGQLFANTYDALRTIETIKASGIEEEIFRRWSGNHARYTNQLQSLASSTYSINALSRLVNDLLTATILLGGGLLVITGSLSIGWLISFRLIYDSFAQPLISLAGTWSQVEQLAGDVIKLDDVEQEQLDIGSSLISLINDQSTTCTIDNVMEHSKETPVSVRIDGLSFSYDSGAQLIVDNVSLDIRAGGRIAFVGQTGCGKSTLLKLIAGLYDPLHGTILYNNLTKEEYGYSNLHQSLAYVTQQSQLIDGSVLDNITLLDDGFTEDDVVKAARMADIDDSISLLPEGYQTRVDSPGFRFSGGQRQRINLARAFLRKPNLLLMDEATSALDANSEDYISTQISELGCTQIIVAHRLNTIISSDTIYYFDRGRVVEMGSHHELLAMGGHYAAQYAVSVRGEQ